MSTDNGPQDASLGPNFSVCSPKILQIHPTLHCNLRCLHCYSSSGPSVRTTLGTRLVLEVISDAAQLGYDVLSISGGEPLLWKDLVCACRHARSCGMKTQIATNGTLLTTRRLEELEGIIDLIAVSLDGPEALHNEIRRSDRAFAQLEVGLENLKASRCAFGVIYTLSRRSTEFLPWGAEFAHSHGASLFQIHPLEFAGRAEHEMVFDRIGRNQLEKAYIASFLFREFYPDMRIQIDLLHRETLKSMPEAIGFPLTGDCTINDSSGLISPMVVEPDGSVVPLAYGMARKYSVCNLYEDGLFRALARYSTNGGYRAFQQLCGTVLAGAQKSGDETPLINWYEMVVKQSNLES